MAPATDRRTTRISGPLGQSGWEGKRRRRIDEEFCHVGTQKMSEELTSGEEVLFSPSDSERIMSVLQHW